MFDKHRMIINARKTLGRDVADVFLPAEAVAINAATQIPNCMSVMVERHSAAGLQPSVGGSTLGKMRKASNLAMELRAIMLEIHGDLGDNVRELAFIEGLEAFVPGCEPNSASAVPSQSERA